MVFSLLGVLLLENMTEAVESYPCVGGSCSRLHLSPLSKLFFTTSLSKEPCITNDRLNLPPAKRSKYKVFPRKNVVFPISPVSVSENTNGRSCMIVPKESVYMINERCFRGDGRGMVAGKGGGCQRVYLCDQKDHHQGL